MQTFLRIVFLALTYWIVGLLVALMAMPPGFAVAAFLPAGMALGALLLFGRRLWPGVLIGSFGLNLSIVYGSNLALSTTDLVMATTIGLGSTFAAVCGEWLITRFCSRHHTLSSERNILVSYFLGGPVSCSISATIATVSFVLLGTEAQQDIKHIWWTLWLGESIGVLLVLPIMYLLFARPRVLWRARWLSLGMPLVVVFTLMAAVFIRVNNAELDKIRESFSLQAQPFSANIKTRLESQLGVLKSIDSLFHTTSIITQSDFENFVATPMQDNPEIYALSWNEYIQHGDREENNRNDTITEEDENGNIITAPERDDYIYVKYIVPVVGNERVKNFNIASIPSRRAVLDRAALTRKAQMTAPIKLVQDTVTSKAMLLFYPVCQPELTGDQTSPHELQGFATAVVFMNRIVEEALIAYGARPTVSVTLEYVNSKGLEVIHRGNNTSDSILSDYVFFKESFEFAGQKFYLTLSPTDTFILQHKNLFNWTVLAFGFLLCALLGGVLLSLSLRSNMIKQQVFERTLELSLILEHASEAILTINNKGSITKINTAAACLLGGSSEDLNNSSIIPYLPNLGLNKNTIDEVFSGKNNSVIETNLTTATNENLAVEIGVSTIEIEGDVYRILIFHDLTERKKSERLKSEFISTISHELRTPLTSINGALRLVGSGALGAVDEKIKKMIDIASTNAERLQQLVGDILDIEKLEFDQVNFNIETFNLVDLINQSIESMEVFAQGYKVNIVKLDDLKAFDYITIRADKNRLIQILVNLLSNAIKYSKPGGDVEIGLSVSLDEATFMIKDYGRGIPEYFKKYIFERFSQADSSDSREKSGTGLGLYITKALVENMSGSIWYESEFGRGSKFFVSLPRPKK
ncbi:ATP-binding protein [Gilvimarinus polysaccharolyticus]|uniref:ATP-binding protein n=1 Tax=Gilvimarinus polysaccharolyticus TaxID=863921 RepID=UPI000673C6E3|nr:ATP-binding protein [Gilvimarinus polysaccharolyticus]